MVMINKDITRDDMVYNIQHCSQELFDKLVKCSSDHKLKIMKEQDDKKNKIVDGYARTLLHGTFAYFVIQGFNFRLRTDQACKGCVTSKPFTILELINKTGRTIHLDAEEYIGHVNVDNEFVEYIIANENTVLSPCKRIISKTIKEFPTECFKLSDKLQKLGFTTRLSVTIDITNEGDNCLYILKGEPLGILERS